ncbi:ATP-binding cassette domain-containing protein [Paenirhodobacter sp.]|uniref:ATP-binding cassette domain-containing protein n=1 Tax=Paenirhodobacter sp. TaxID=1965326 RepID=UPI003B506335
MIALDLQAKRFGAEVVLGPMRLEVAAGEVLGVAGPSGVGKSALLRILAGLDRDFEGRLSASPRRPMVFQSPTLMPWRRVLANVTIPTGATAAAARALLERVGLRGLEDHYPGQISLGQARRVALARAFAARPEVLILDEPFASLDAERIGDLLALTAALISELRPAVILASHSAAELEALSTRRVRLEGRPARLIEDQRARVRAGS